MDEKSLKSCYVFIGAPGGLSWDGSFCLKSVCAVLPRTFYYYFSEFFHEENESLLWFGFKLCRYVTPGNVTCFQRVFSVMWLGSLAGSGLASDELV